MVGMPSNAASWVCKGTARSYFCCESLCSEEPFQTAVDYKKLLAAVKAIGDFDLYCHDKISSLFLKGSDALALVMPMYKAR